MKHGYPWPPIAILAIFLAIVAAYVIARLT